MTNAEYEFVGLLCAGFAQSNIIQQVCSSLYATVDLIKYGHPSVHVKLPVVAAHILILITNVNSQIFGEEIQSGVVVIILNYKLVDNNQIVHVSRHR